MSAEKSIIIIGGGIAGLSAGCYARMNGYKTTIFEMHNIPGGLCTSWTRKGYTFNGCIHRLVGTRERSAFYKLWNEVGALGAQQVVYFDEFVRFEASNGEVIILYSDADRLEDHLKQVAPEDSGIIGEFCDAIRKASKHEMPVEVAPEVMGLAGTVKMLRQVKPFMPLMKRWASVSMMEVSRELKNPALAEMFSEAFAGEMPVFFFITALAWLNNGVAGYPVGGSLLFARTIEKRFQDLGGEIAYRSKVKKILTENDKAVGVVLADGTEHRADFVISAADGHSTIYKMLEGRYISRKIKGIYEEEKLQLSKPIMFVSLGINHDFKDIPRAIYHSTPFKPSLELGSDKVDRMDIRYYNFDATLAPQGKTSIIAFFNTNFEYWLELKNNDPEKYKKEKERVADAVVAELERRHPGISRKVEVRDVATPYTFLRYTDNWLGTFIGWQVTSSTYRIRIPKSLPGLGNFLMCGQWVSVGGGLPVGVMTGRHVIQILCKKDKREFVTTFR